MKIDLSQTEFGSIFQGYTRALEEKSNLNAALEKERNKNYSLTDEKETLKRKNLDLQGSLDGLTARLSRLEKNGKASQEEVRPTPEEMIKILRPILMDVAQGRKIEAIRLVREATQLGLKEAKDLVEGNE